MIDTQALTAAMKRKNLNHRGLAQKAGICRSAVTKLLNGYGDPNYVTILGIVRALDMEPEEAYDVFFRDRLQKEPTQSIISPESNNFNMSEERMIDN